MNAKRHIWAILPVVVLMMWGCTGSGDTDRSLNTAEELLEERPDSAETILRDLGRHTMTRGQQARLTKLTVQSRFRQGKTFILEEGIDDAIEYFREANDTVALIGMCRLAAIGSGQKGDQAGAAAYIEKAIEAAGDSNQRMKSELLVTLANLYAYPTLPKDYRKAIEYSLEAASRSNDEFLKSRALHDAGIFYAFLDEADQAKAYLDSAMRTTSPENPEYSTYALNYAGYPATDPQKSIAYLDGIKGESLGKLITKGFIYLNIQMTDSAACYLIRSKKLYHRDPEKYSINTYNSLRMLEECVNHALGGTVDPSRGTVPNDSISARIAIQRRYAAELADRNSQLRINLLESRNRNQQAIMTALVILIAALLTGGAIYQRNKMKYLRVRKELDAMRLDQIMAEAEQEQTAAATEIISKRSAICMERFMETGLAATIQKAETLLRNKAVYLPMKERDRLRDALLECFSDFIVDVRMDGGKLSMDDLLTCILSLMRWSNMAVAACTGVTEGAIRTRKTRLKGKLSQEMSTLIFG